MRTAAGSWMPLDESSDDERGRWVIETGRLTRQLVGVELEHARENGILLFTNHLAGCVGNNRPKGTPCPPHLREALGLKPLED
ncbi:MAG: hypothetical protein Q4G46_14905 [Propionibacteriaceae bacterium]|nr:hypothetical protein [Propionibacteriaceae bacterium]